MKINRVFLLTAVTLSFAHPAFGLSASAPGDDARERASGPQPNETLRTGEEVTEARARALETHLADLRERVSQLRERMRRLECVTEGCESTSAARLVIMQRSDLAPFFALESAVYSLDGARVTARTEIAGTLPAAKEFEVRRLTLPPGAHLLSVHLAVRGRAVGPIDYGERYRFEMDAGTMLRLEPGRSTEVEVIAFDKGMTEPFTGRPAVRVDVATRP
jgi:hypothetical protein